MYINIIINTCAGYMRRPNLSVSSRPQLVYSGLLPRCNVMLCSINLWNPSQRPQKPRQWNQLIHRRCRHRRP